MTQKDLPWIKSYPPEVSFDVDTRPFENLNDLFDYVVRRYADKTAYINMSGHISYENLAVEVEYFAAFLQKYCKLKKGDRLAIMMPNLIQYPIALFAALKAGLTVVNINPLYTPRELGTQLADCKADAIVVIANYAFNLQKVIGQTRIRHVIVTGVGDALGFFRGRLVNFMVRSVLKMVPKFIMPNSISFKKALRIGSQLTLDPVLNRYDDIAFLQYTGGTTGKPKGAELTHGNIIANISELLAYYGSVVDRGQETVVTALPLYHIFAMTVNCMLFFAIGATNILITDPRRIKDFIKELKHHPDISIFTGVNTLFNALLNHPDFEHVALGRLRLVIGGGAAVQSGVAQRFKARTGLNILEGYGLTECSPVCSVCPYTAKEYTGSIGLPLPGTYARIIDADDNEIWDLNTPGELEIKGPQVMKGYYHNEEDTKKVMHDGYVRTGDIAVWLEGGYIKIIDRLKAMILVSGFNVFPSEIEDVVSKFDKVLDCAAIGVKSDKTGEAIKLFVVKRDPSVTAEEIKDYCRSYLTPYKIPHIVEFTNDLPKSAIGKVLRRRLRTETK